MLNAQSLPALAARGFDVPGYPRSGAPGVVHLGLGAFHRAHQALAFDTLLRTGDRRWGVLGVGMRHTELADALAAQDGLYSVHLADAQTARWQVGGAIWQTCVAAREPQTVHRAIAAPATRWVTLTVTEKAYTPELGRLLAQGLALRHAAGLPGLTVASCDNLSGNGRKLQALCQQAAREIDRSLAAWIERACAFPNSMVDRIVPAATPQCLLEARQALGVADACALATEDFWEWVIERRFADAADAETLAGAGVLVVTDAGAYEDAKLRMLNGSHTAIACIGAVAGLPLVSDCVAQPALRGFVHALLTQEIAPQVRRADWAAYRDALLRRFANPLLRHSVFQIANDSSQKIPQRWLPSILDRIGQGLGFERLAFAAAAWMRHCQGVDEQGRDYAINDPLAAQLQSLARRHAGDAPASAAALCTLPSIWGEILPQHLLWQQRTGHWLGRIQSQGMLAALAQINAELENGNGSES